MTSPVAAPPMIRWPYRCRDCKRQWCVIAIYDRDVDVQSCLFCGEARITAGPGETLVARELRGGVR